jgi:hypothetical protein
MVHRPCRRRLGSGECRLGCGRTILGCLEALLQPRCCCRRGWLIHLEIYERVQKMQWYTHNIYIASELLSGKLQIDIACLQRWVRNMRTLLLLAAMLSGVQGYWIKRRHYPKRAFVALSRTNQPHLYVYIYSHACMTESGRMQDKQISWKNKNDKRQEQEDQVTSHPKFSSIYLFRAFQPFGPL